MERNLSLPKITPSKALTPGASVQHPTGLASSTTAAAKNTGFDFGGASSVLGGITSIFNTSANLAKTADISGQNNTINEIENTGNQNYSSFDDIASSYNQISENNNNLDLSYDTIRGGSKGERVGGVLSSAATGAMTGLSVGGPWGCVCAGTRVIKNNGQFVNIEDLKQSDGIIGWDGTGSVTNDIVAMQAPLSKECVQITFDNGEILKCSLDHPILAHHSGRGSREYINGKRVRKHKFEFVEAKDLVAGDWAASISEIPVFGEMDIANARLIGMLIGDGTYGKKHGARLATANPETWEYLERQSLGVCCERFTNSTKYNVEFRIYRILDGASIMRSHGLYGQTHQSKRLPKDIERFSKKSLADLLGGLFDTDGCVVNCKNEKESRIEFSQTNLTLLRSIKEQLIKFGIHSFIKTGKAQRSVIKNRTVVSKANCKLVIKDADSVIRFYDNIHLMIKYKYDALEKLVKYKYKVVKRRPRYNGIYAVRIKSITPIGVHPIYNLQADVSHTYIADTIITHNCLVGAAVGLGAGLAGVFTGNAEARYTKGIKEVQAKQANEIAGQNLVAATDRLKDSQFRDSYVNRAALGGKIEREKTSMQEFADAVNRNVRKADKTHSAGFVHKHVNGGTMIRIKR